jgi:hypothetical protein
MNKNIIQPYKRNTMRNIYFNSIQILIFLMVNTVFGQVFNYSPQQNTTFQVSDAIDNLQDRTVEFSPVNNQGMTVGYSIVSQDFPAEWGYTICDNSFCYSSIPDNVEYLMLPTTAIDYVNRIFPFFKLSINTNFTAGTGVIIFRVYDSTNPAIYDLLTITFATNTLAVDEFDKKTFSFYPNPASKNFTIINNDKNFDFTITDTLGKKVLSGNSKANKKTIDISNLKAGLYLISIHGEKSAEVKKLIII